MKTLMVLFSGAVMLLLLFQIEESLYAIDTDKILKIMPMVQLRKMATAPDYLAGVFSYGGQIVPVVDLCQLLRGTPCQICYSTRLILVTHQFRAEENTGQATNGALGQSPLGLMAERVTETIKISPNELNKARQVSLSPFLGDLWMDEKGMIQRIHWEDLLTAGMVDQPPLQNLLQGGGDRANGAGRN